MVKYVNNMVTFEEIPLEVTLSLSISNCTNRCPGCHSAELRQNIGIELTNEVLDNLIKKNSGVSCVLFLGEGNDKEKLIKLAAEVKNHSLKVALYSGRDEVEREIWDNFDYVKIGRWDKSLGPLNKRSTNQRLFKIENGERIDITSRFWR